jgi:hypothetical protein
LARGLQLTLSYRLLLFFAAIPRLADLNFPFLLPTDPAAIGDRSAGVKTPDNSDY